MKKKFALLAIVLLAIGIFFATASHDTHKAYKIDFSLEHSQHQMYGGILAVIGFILLVVAIKK